MFNSKFRRCLVALGVVFLFGVGYHFYNSHLEFNKTFLDTEGLDTETSQHSLDNPDDETNDSTALREQDWSTYDKQEWETYWSNQKPVKVRYARTSMPSDESVTTVPSTGPPKKYSKEDMVLQLVETPDGQVHEMYWFEKLEPGQAIPTDPKYWSFRDQVIVDGVMYDVPEWETTDSYLNKIHLSTMYDVPLESVGSLIEEGVIPSSPKDAQSDPLFDDPLFVKREDSRPVEARSPWLLSDWGLSESDLSKIVYLDENDQPIPDWVPPSGDGGEIEGFSSGEIDTAGNSASEQSPLADDSDNSLADALEKPKLPESMVTAEKQLTPAVSEGVSPKLVDKAQQLIDPLGTEERLRRLLELRESDPDAARQFERERSPKSARDVPDDGQSER